MKTKYIKKIIIGLVTVGLLYSAYTYYQFTTNQSAREAACFEGLMKTVESGTPVDEIFKKEFDTLQLLVEYSLVARSEMLEVSNRLKENGDAPLASRDLLILKQGTEDYLDIREDLYAIANAYECAAEVEASTLVKYNIDPKLRLKALMLSLGAALTLYDNYLLGTVLFEQDGRLRKVINDPDMGFGLVSNKLREMTLAANSIENRSRIRSAISFYEENKSTIADADEDSDFAYLALLIESSASYNYVKQLRVKEIASRKLGEFERITEDLASETTKTGFDKVSGLFGNTIGLYESRKGKLFGNEDAKRKIQSVLQPLDILLEKTPSGLPIS